MNEASLNKEWVKYSFRVSHWSGVEVETLQLRPVRDGGAVVPRQENLEPEAMWLKVKT